MTRFLPVALIATLAGVAASPQLSCADPITPAEIKHEGPVDFRKEILPILQKKCLACHNATDAEGELVLESPQTMAKGGSTGPGVVAGKPDESLFFTLAARRDEPVMPPEDNKVGAKPLTPEELGLIKLWIEQGAMGSAGGETDTIKWQPLPAGVNPIYAVAISPDGQWAAAARANQIFLYHVPTKREYGRLTDPAILATGLYKNPGVAHVDLVQSMRFSPDSQLLVSGEYRTVKFWQRKRDSRLQEWTGIDSPIRSLTRSADGSLVALGLENGRIQLVETATGTRKAVLEGIHTGAVMGGSFNKAGDRLVTGGQDKLLVVWDVAAGKPAAKLEAPDAIQSVLFVAEDQQVAVGGTDGVIRSWAVASIPAVGATATGIAATKEYAGHSGAVSSLAAVPSNAGQFVSGGQDGTVRVWDVAGGKQLQQIAHGGPVTQVAVRADGQRLISSSANHTVKLWNGADYKMIAELKRDYRTEVANEDLQRAVAVAKRHVEGANADLKQANERKAAEDKNVAAATESHKKAADELAKKVEAEKKPLADKLAADMALASAQATATKLAEAKKAAEAAVPAADVVIQKAQAELDAAAKSIASVDEAAKQAAEQLAKLRETVAQAEKAAAQAAEKQKAALAEKAAKEKAVAEAVAAKKAAEEAKKKTEMELAAAQEGVKQAEQKANAAKDPAQKATDEKVAAEKAVQSAMRSVERAQDSAGKAAAAVPMFEAAVKQMEESQKTAEAAAQSAVAAATAAEKPVLTVAFSADGKTFATGGEDQIVRTWDAETGASIDTFTGHGAGVSFVTYLANGNLLSAAANQTVFVWNTSPPWEIVRTIGSPDGSDIFADRVTALDFSPDGSILATGGGEPSRSGQLKLFKTADGSLLKEIPDAHSDVIYGLEFSPDGKQLASCGADRFAKVFDVESGKLVRAFEGHTHHVLGVTWRADGRTLATSGADMAVKVWDVKTGDQQRTIQGFNKEVTAIRFVAESDNVVASCGDASVQLTNAANGRNVRGFSGASDFVHCCGVTANGKLIVAGGQDSVLRLWTAEGKEYAQFPAP